MRNTWSAVLLLAAACGGSAPPAANTADAVDAEQSSPEQVALESAPPPPEVKPLEPTGDVERIYALSLAPGAPARGPEDAKVQVEVFSDFQCPFCATHVGTVNEIIEAYGDLVRVEWRHFPLPFHPDAGNAAQASVEVQAQAGDAGFWRYHDLLFQNQSDLSVEKLVEYAGQIEGVVATEVRAAIEDGRHIPRIQEDMNTLGLSGAPTSTPSTFVNGRLISGAQPLVAFEPVIEEALKETPEERAAAEALSTQAYPLAKASHILVQYKGAMHAGEDVTRSRDEAQERAEQLRARAAMGENFADLARENSDGPSAEQGGDLGQFTRGDLVPEFEAVVFGIEPGQIGPVVETPFGYHVIQRTE